MRKSLLHDKSRNRSQRVKRWQEEKVEIEAKIAGIENFQKLVLEQQDEVILEFIKDLRRRMKEQRSRNSLSG